MRQNAFLFLFAAIVFGWSASPAEAQSKVVTNAELEKFKLKRVQAEEGLKDYYRRLGLTAEEVAKRDAQEAKDREELSLRLRAARLEQERLDRERIAAEASAADAMQLNIVIPQNDPVLSGYYLYGNRWYPRRRGPWIGQYPPNGIVWRAGGGGVIYEPGSRSSMIYSPVPAQRTRPAWRNPRRPR